MSRIRILPENVASKIAVGEVVERPNASSSAASSVAAGEGGALKNFIWLDSLPSYEAVLVRSKGTVSVQTFESLWGFPATEGKGPHGEECHFFNDEILVPTGSRSRLRWACAEGILRHPWQGQLTRLNLVGASVDCSPNHPICKQAGNRKWGQGGYTEAGKIKVGHSIASRFFCLDANGRDLAEQKGCPPLFIGPVELAWFYGLYAAEGWVNKNCVSVCNSNRWLLRRAADVLRDVFHLNPCFNTPRLGVGTIDVRCQRLANHLRSLCYLPGARPSSRTKTVPDVILNARQEVRDAWLEGYFAGDGTRRRGRWDGAGSVSRALLLGVSYLVRKPFTVHIRDDKPDFLQMSFSTRGAGKGNQGGPRKNRCLVKKLGARPYEGFLYDLVEVDSPDHSYYAGVGNVRLKNTQDIAGVADVLLRQSSSFRG